MSNPPYPPPGGGFPPPDGSQNGFPPPGGYQQPGNYPPPGGYQQPGNYPPPGGYQQPGYQPPYQQPPVYGYGQQQIYATPQVGPAGTVSAGFGTRLVAIIIDWIIVSIVTGIIQAILPYSSLAMIGGAIGYAIYAVLTSLYFDGATIGKMILGIKVVDARGNTPDIGPLILRYTLGYWISSFVCGIGYLTAAFDSQKQAWHDKLASTYVVYKNQSSG